ncbi:MAG: TonB-dependent receptor [Bacteroidota bacterium]
MKYVPLFLALCPFLVGAQSGFTISGLITDADNNPLPYVNIRLDRNNKYAVSDENGVYVIKRIRRGEYTITVSSLGFVTQTRNISVNGNEKLNFSLNENVENLEDVTVYGKNEATKISQKAITISSLDVQQVASLSLGAEEVLKTATGVVVRQSGGLGSDLNINLNGLSGNAVRTYYDGIPLQVYGSGIQLNNIPVDALERIDAYKGVMPVDIGTDALGGGINLVPVEQYGDALRASYSVGSFNTHRITLNGNRNFNDKTSLSVVSFFNYSDNDYEMRNIPNVVENIQDDGTVLGVSEEIIDARRFHNRHRSGFVEGTLTLKDRAWADKFSFSASYANRYDQAQQGQFIISTAIGEADQTITGFNQRLDYRKKLFNDKLSLRYFGILSNTTTKTNDSTTAIYDWRGNRLVTENSSGSEIFAIPTLREGRNLGTAHRIIANLGLAQNLNLKVSNFYRYSREKGEDPVGVRITINGEAIDPNTIPSKLTRNIFGVQLEQKWFNGKLTALAFYKNYRYNAESIDILSSSATQLPVREVNATEDGYGVALKYQVLESLFVRGSFERAIRIPTEGEVFGNFAAILPNYELRPESSNNVNAGVTFDQRLGKEGFVTISLDGFIRDQENLIRLEPFGPENAIFRNQAKVDGQGFEFSAKVTPVRNVNLSANLTYQSNQFAENNNASSQSIIGIEIPNIPQFFYNVGGNYKIERIFRSPNSLSLFYTYFFLDRFSINLVSDLDTANPDFVIPEQHVHNTGITYALEETGWSFSLNVQNMFNAELFDNFRIPRPGFNYAFKINYSL